MASNSDEYDLFVSYARLDDAADWITSFVARLQEEHRKYSGGREFRIFFDTSAIRSLDDWQHRIYGGLAASRLLLAFISPAYLASKWCREEWRTWIDVEIAKHVLSEGAAAIYIIEAPWLRMTEEQIAQEIAQLSDPPPAHDVKTVADQISRRQLTKVIQFFDGGVEALRKEDLRKVLVDLAQDLATRSERVEAALNSKSTIPPYNRRFVGRLNELTQLRKWLFQGRSGVITAYERSTQQAGMVSVQGLGGIGKTELAFTYAHAYAGLYPGGRFLVPCDGRSDLRLAMLALDEVFHDLITDEQRKTPDLHFAAIRDCLRQRVRDLGRTLLVLDNVTDAALLLPEQIDHVKMLGSDLHMLVTTRLGAPEAGEYDDVEWLTLGELDVEDGLRLLEKYRPYASPLEQVAAEHVVRQLGGFALCIEVVGAYLGQHHEQNYAGFLEASGLNKLEQADEAALSPGVTTRRHNNERRLGLILAATLTGLPPQALMALRFASLLPPDNIPLTWLKSLVESKHAELASDTRAWPSIVSLLLSLALLTRAQHNSGELRMVRSHRLLQDYVRGRFAEHEETEYQQAVDALVKERVAGLGKAHWSDVRWELTPLDALAPIWGDRSHPLASWLLNGVGVLWERVAEFTRAEPPLRRSLAIREKARGPDHPDVATSLNNLALLYKDQGRYAEAEPLLRRALAIREKALGPDHPDVATRLDNLALLYNAQGRYAEAEPLYMHALAIREKALGPDHADVAQSLNNLAFLYNGQERYAEAEPLLTRALVIKEKALGPDHPSVATSLNNLAFLYDAQGHYAEAEPLYVRALAIREKALGPDHPDVATSLNNLAGLYGAQGRYAEAEPLATRALATWEKALGPDHPDVATSLNDLAVLYDAQGRYGEAEPLLRRALAIREKALGPDHPETNKIREVLLAVRQRAIEEKALLPDHPDEAASLNTLAAVYTDQGRYAEAEPLLTRALVIWEKALGPDHPDVAASLNNLAFVYSHQGRYAEAEPLYARALAIWEKALGADHPDVATSLNGLANVYALQGRYAEAEPLQARALAIRQKALGPDHIDVAVSLTNYADLYTKQGRYAEAEPLYARALPVLEKALGPDHPLTKMIRENLLAIRQNLK